MSTEVIAWPRVEESSRPLVDRLHDWVATVDHKRLGIMYMLYALVFLVIGGLEATIIRIQLSAAHKDFVSPQVFNRMFTMHGTTMIFFVVMPLVFGLANYLIPLMIGARDMAFPRLNAFSFWLTAFGGILLYFSVVGANGLYGAGNAPDVGWFAYAPLTSRTFSPGHSTDFWTLGLLVSGFGSIGTAINIIVTIMCMRCPGMKLGKMPLLVWLNLVMGGLVILAVSPLSAAQIMLLIDRYLGGHFFDTQAGGSAVIWMHFFWIFGHPEVYVLVIPAFAVASEIIPVFSRKAIFGYPVMVAATVCIGFIGMSVWAHHMFTVGMSSNAHVVLCRIPISIPDRRTHRDHAGRSTIRLAARKLLFCRRAFSLRDCGWNPVLSVRRVLLLVPEDVRKNVQRDAGETAFLAVSYWLSPDVRFHAHSRPARDASASLHLRARPRVGHLEFDCDRWRVFSSAGDIGFCCQSDLVVFPREDCRQRSVGRMDLGMGYQLTAAGI